MAFEACHNPLCGASVGPSVRKKRSFCSDECKMDGWVLKRAGELLADLPPERKRAILGNGSAEIMGKSRSAPSGKINGKSKRYLCRRWPYLSIGKRVKFQDGYFATADLEVQKIIERSSDFGAHILEVEGDTKGDAY